MLGLLKSVNIGMFVIAVDVDGIGCVRSLYDVCVGAMIGMDSKSRSGKKLLSGFSVSNLYRLLRWKSCTGSRRRFILIGIGISVATWRYWDLQEVGSQINTYTRELINRKC